MRVERDLKRRPPLCHRPTERTDWVWQWGQSQSAAAGVESCTVSPVEVMEGMGRMEGMEGMEGMEVMRMMMRMREEEVVPQLLAAAWLAVTEGQELKGAQLSQMRTSQCVMG